MTKEREQTRPFTGVDSEGFGYYTYLADEINRSDDDYPISYVEVEDIAAAVYLLKRIREQADKLEVCPFCRSNHHRADCVFNVVDTFLEAPGAPPSITEEDLRCALREFDSKYQTFVSAL